MSVISFHNPDLSPPAAQVPDPDVIDLCRRLLAKAESGFLQALGVVTLDPDSCAAYEVQGQVGAYGLIGASVKLTQCLAQPL